MALSGWGDGNYIEHAAATSINDLTTWTMAAWVYPQHTGSERMNIMGKGTMQAWSFDPTFGTGFANHNRATTDALASFNLANLAAWGANKWLFIVAQLDSATASNCRIFAGDLTTNAAEPSSYNTQTNGSGTWTSDAGSNLRIGRHVSATGRQWVGRIASWHVYNKILSTAEIRQLQWNSAPDMGTRVLYSEYGYTGGTASQPDWSGDGNPGTVTGTLTVAGHAPVKAPFGFKDDYSIATGSTASPSVGSIVFTGLAPAVTTQSFASPTVGAIAFTGFAPTVTTQSFVSPSVGSITFTGVAPTVAGGTIEVTPTVGGIAFTGFAPTVGVGQSAFPSTGEISFTGLAPTVTGGTIEITPTVGEIAFTGLAPTVSGGQAYSVTTTVAGGVRNRRTLHILPDKRIAYATKEEMQALFSYYPEEEVEEVRSKQRIRKLKVKASEPKDIIAELRAERENLLIQEEREVFYVMQEIARLI